jgi:secreted trypsin-like serine protease
VEGSGPFFVVAGGSRIAVTSHSAAGQTTLLTIASPLPAQYIPIATGDASNDSTFTIAGYGTAHEAERMHSAGLREAKLVSDSKYGGLVDPKRHGPISASACMGDSGGPVAKFDGKRYVLVGIVERVSNFAGVGACGFLTHFSAVSGTSNYASAASSDSRQASEPRATRRVAGKKHQWAER